MPFRYQPYEPSDNPLTEDIVPLNDDSMPLSPEIAWRKAFMPQEKTRLSTRGKFIVGMNTLAATCFTATGTLNMLADKPYYVINFTAAALFGLTGAVNSRNASYREKK